VVTLVCHHLFDAPHVDLRIFRWYLLELYQLAPEIELARLRKELTDTYLLLDPMLPKEGVHLRRWRIQLNVTPQELEAING
jgi:predicted transcriptional regulator of viral defense system